MLSRLAATDGFNPLEELFESFRRNYDGRAEISWWEIAAYAAGVVLLIVVFVSVGWLARRSQRIRRVNHPRSLFTEICKAHHFPRRARWFLYRVACQVHAKHPARLLLEPDALQPEAWADALRVSREEAVELRRVLYGDFLADPLAIRSDEAEEGLPPVEPELWQPRTSLPPFTAAEDELTVVAEAP